MKISKLTTLTLAQELIVQPQWEKWERFVLSTERIDRAKAVEAMKSIYTLMGEEEPNFIICDSPHEALSHISADSLHLGRRIEKNIRRPLREQIESQLTLELIEALYSELRPDRLVLQGQMESCVERHLNLRKFIAASHWFDLSILLDLGNSILGCIYDRQKGDVIRSVLENTGWILPYSKTCIICDRPTRISFSLFDDGEYIHADGEAAIYFADGFSMYVHHGQLIREVITQQDKY
jgi:hypothetical protein